MNVENGIIESADIVLEEPCGKQGLNCLLRLWVELSGGGVGISFNPVKIPLILENLGVKSLKKLEGQPIRLKIGGLGSECKAISHLLLDKWVESDNGFYFGSDWTLLGD